MWDEFPAFGREAEIAASLLHLCAGTGGLCGGKEHDTVGIGALTENWQVLGAMVLSSVIAGGLVGWFLTRWRVLPGNTAAWGASPGGASAMIALAEAYGSDVHMVAMVVSQILFLYDLLST